MPDRNKKKAAQPVPAGSNDDWSDSDLPVVDDKLSQSVANVESEGGDYSAVNQNTGAMGKYQFVPSHHWKDIQRITGVKSQNEFLDNPEAQERYFEWHTKNNLEPAAKRISGLNKDGYSDQQLKMLVHFKGEGGAKKWLQNHEDDTTDNNIPISKYLGAPQQQAADTWDDKDLPIVDDGQKKSPGVSVPTLAAPSQTGQNGVSQNEGLFDKDKPAFADSVLKANQHLDWVQRLYDKNPQTIQVPGEPFPSTHLMADNGNGYVFPYGALCPRGYDAYGVASGDAESKRTAFGEAGCY